MSTAIIDKEHLGHRAIPQEAETLSPEPVQPTCPLESLQHHGLECKLCTWYTVVGPAEFIQQECQVVNLVVKKLLDGVARSAFPVSPTYAEPAQSGVQSGSLHSKANGGAIFSPYDALGMAEDVDNMPALDVSKRKRRR
jgi:hypothetical protein